MHIPRVCGFQPSEASQALLVSQSGGGGDNTLPSDLVEGNNNMENKIEIKREGRQVGKDYQVSQVHETKQNEVKDLMSLPHPCPRNSVTISKLAFPHVHSPS
jgi:hypothetical protein